MEMRVRDRRTEGSRSHEHVEEEEEDANDQVKSSCVSALGNHHDDYGRVLCTLELVEQ